jgi:hypothetical protein
VDSATGRPVEASPAGGWVDSATGRPVEASPAGGWVDSGIVDRREEGDEGMDCAGCWETVRLRDSKP